MENYFYECIYDVLHSHIPHGDTSPILRRFKAKIVKLHSASLKTVKLDNYETDKFEDGKRTLFHILQMQRRRTARTIRSVQGALGHIQRSHKCIVHAFTTYLRQM